MECRNRQSAPGFAGNRRIWTDREFKDLSDGENRLLIAALVELLEGNLCFVYRRNV